MATRKNGKTEVVETAAVETEVVETAPVETEVVEAPLEQVENKEVETTEMENKEVRSTEYTAVDIVCNDCDDLDVDELKQVIDYCSNRIDELQREEVEALEEQMRAIQDKLMALKGFRLQSKTVTGEKSEAKRVATPLVNPKNPTEVYTFGKHPDWVVKLMAETGKTVYQLREEAAKAQVAQAQAEAEAQV